MRNLRHYFLYALVFLSIQASTIADDTDIYVNALPTANAEPMIFLTLDYRSNLGSNICTEVSPKNPASACGVLLGDAYPALNTGPGQVSLFDGMRAVFATLFDELQGVKVAFLMNHDDSCTGARAPGGPGVTGCSNGAYILKGLKSFDASDTNGAKASMISALNALPTPQGNLSHAYQGKEMYFEMFRYLTGQAWHNAHLGWSDFGTNASQNLPTDNPLLAWDPTIESGASYVSPFVDVTEFACSQAYAVNIMFGTSNQDADADSRIADPVASGGMGIGINSPDFNQVISHMYNTDFAPTPSNGTWPDIDGNQNLQSYFIAAQVNNTTNSYAADGGTISAISLANPSKLLDDLRVIFNEILSVSTTLVAASVPVNVFNRSDIVDNIFLAQFAVDENARPYWNGNLKKLRLEETTDELGSSRLALVDVFDNDAIAPDGRITFDALTFWTDPTTLPAPVGTEVAQRDGRAVARGGAGQLIPGFLPSGAKTIGDANSLTTRKLFTEPSSGSTLLPLNVSNAATLQSSLGVATVPLAENLIRWIRGQDVDDLDVDTNRTEARPWIMGAPLHSRPLPINYGARSAGYTQSNPDIRIYMGSDDGFMHSFRNTTTLGGESGVEDWAFMPRSVMNKMPSLRLNAIGTSHPYTVDGAPAAYIVDTEQDGTIGLDRNLNVDPTDKAYLYFGLRRGGTAYYALDVTNPDVPAYLWSLTKTGDFAEIGMTFSAPRVGKVKFGATSTPVIIFGGGYDPGKDSGNANDSQGNAIYIVNALTGALVWKTTYGGTTGNQSATVFHHSGMVDGIPSDVAALDSNADGNIDRLYVGDSGGTVWRVDLPEGATDVRNTWFASELANLGRDDISPDNGVNDRRFFHRPDFVPSIDSNGAFDAVLIGSGNRADPRESTTNNWFYMIKDRNVVSGSVVTSPVNHSDWSSGSNPLGLGDITNTCIDDSVCFAEENLTNGWKLQMEGPGEKILAPALTAYGTIFFTSFLPEGTGAEAGSPCAPSEGGGRLYAVSIVNGAPTNNYNSTGDSAGAITKTDRFNNLASGGIPAEVVPIGDYILPPDLNPVSTGGRSFWKTYWYEKNVDNL